jgi:2-polyprenyl-3-methyl-5-hydroxy-6-metoxy-1,4-benzoquinol methylase
MSDQVVPPHLGGSENFTHCDEGALNCIINKFNIKSFLDIGCGPGWMVKMAQEKGLDALGVDGDFTVIPPKEIKDRHIIHDFSLGPWIPPRKFDLAWTVEFVEHVECRYVSNFVEPMKHCKYIIMTHAIPNQPGHHHVNCRNEEYWVNVIEAFGFMVDEDTTNKVRKSSTMEEKYMRQQSLFFRNLNYTDS